VFLNKRRGEKGKRRKEKGEGKTDRPVTERLKRRIIPSGMQY
jgi:hypothetical protein